MYVGVCRCPYVNTAHTAAHTNISQCACVCAFLKGNARSSYRGKSSKYKSTSWPQGNARPCTTRGATICTVVVMWPSNTMGTKYMMTTMMEVTGKSVFTKRWATGCSLNMARVWSPFYHTVCRIIYLFLLLLIESGKELKKKILLITGCSWDPVSRPDNLDGVSDVSRYAGVTSGHVRHEVWCRVARWEITTRKNLPHPSKRCNAPFYLFIYYLYE